MALVDDDKFDEIRTEIKQQAKEFCEQKKASSEKNDEAVEITGRFSALSGAL